MKSPFDEEMKRFRKYLFYAAAMAVSGIILSLCGMLLDSYIPLRLTFASAGRHMNILAIGGNVCTLIGIGFWVAAFLKRAQIIKDSNSGQGKG